MSAYIGGVVAVLLACHLVFILAAYLRRNDIADVFWGLGFLVAAAGAIMGSGITESLQNLQVTELTILFCVGVWALRLAYHIGRRFLKSHEEDVRYANWRKEWGSGWLLRTYLQVFLLQAVFLIIISLPVLRSIALAPRSFTYAVGIGLLVWIFGFIFEAVGDEQLRRFKLNPSNKGRLMDRGLWSWSRHPNYFGEVVQWWGIFLMCVEPGGWWLIISPIVITFLILKVSGVPMLEKLMEGRPGFAEYKQRTALFFPRPPK